MRFSMFYEKITLKNFQVFNSFLNSSVRTEIDLNGFFGKNIDLRFLVQKGPYERGPKWFQKYIF